MKQLLSNKNYTFPAALILLLAVVLYCINYTHYLSFLPWGPHIWRQTDSLAFTMHYYFHDAPFFEPGTYNAECANGNAASEFPILYYITSLIWNLTGYQPIVLKLINTFIFFTGIVYLYKSFVLLTKNYWVGIGMCLVLASSTVVLYYTNNFIPDPPAVGFTLIGLYHFLEYTQSISTKHLAYAFAFFTLASLIKISVFILPFSIVALFALEKVFKFNLLRQKPLFAGKTVYYITIFSAYFFIVLAWVWWIKQYNAQNTCTLFLTDIKPIWECDAATRAHAWERLSTKWYKAYYFPPVLIFFALLIGVGIANYRNISRVGGALIILNVVGSIVYYLLFFYQFIAHDYYAIVLLIPLSVVLLFITQSVFKSNIQWLRSPMWLAGMIVLAGFAFADAKEQLAERMDVPGFYPDYSTDMYTIAPYLDKIGISPDEKVFSLPDPTPNSSLILMNRRGFTSFHDYEGMTYTDMLVNYAKQGAKYLVIGDPKYYKYVDTPGIVCTQIGAYHAIKIYSYRLTEK